jgi:hypothetical protein
MIASSVHKSSGLGKKLARFAVLGVAVGSLMGGFTVLAGVSPAGAIPTNLWVSPYGSDTSNPCTVKANPCQTLQHAYNVSSANQTINLAGGTFRDGGLVISHNLNIVGTSSDGSLDVVTSTITRSGTNDDMLTVNGVTVTISDVVMDGNKGVGDAIYVPSPSKLTLNDVNVVNNIATFFDGAAIENQGTLIMNGGSISENTINSTDAQAAGAGLSNNGSATLTDVALNHDVANFEGGAILNFDGPLKLLGSTAIHNNSAFLGGGIEECPAATLTVGPHVSITDNTPNNINHTDPDGACI